MNNEDKRKNLMIVYQEVVDARKQQQDDLVLISNKFNWSIVSNFVLLGFIINLKNYNFLMYSALFLLVLSLFISIQSLKIVPFKRGPLFLDMLDASTKINHDSFLNALNIKVAGDIVKNKEEVKAFTKRLSQVINLLIASVLLVALNFFIPIIIKILQICLCKI